MPPPQMPPTPKGGGPIAPQGFGSSGKRKSASGARGAMAPAPSPSMTVPAKILSATCIEGANKLKDRTLAHKIIAELAFSLQATLCSRDFSASDLSIDEIEEAINQALGQAWESISYADQTTAFVALNAALMHTNKQVFEAAKMEEEAAGKEGKGEGVKRRRVENGKSKKEQRKEAAAAEAAKLADAEARNELAALQAKTAALEEERRRAAQIEHDSAAIKAIVKGASVESRRAFLATPAVR